MTRKADWNINNTYDCSAFSPSSWVPVLESHLTGGPTFHLHMTPFSSQCSLSLGGLRLKTWDHAPSHPRLLLIKPLCSWFCWILVCCALPTLQKHTLTESHVVSCSITPYTWLKCDGREKWAAGSWGQGRDCDLTCNQTFYQSSLTSEGPGPLREAQEHWKGAVIVPHLPPPPQQDSLYNDQGGHLVSQFTGQK